MKTTQKPFTKCVQWAVCGVCVFCVRVYGVSKADLIATNAKVLGGSRRRHTSWTNGGFDLLGWFVGFKLIVFDDEDFVLTYVMMRMRCTHVRYW